MKLRAALLIVFLAASAQAATVIPLGQYVNTLTNIKSLLETKQIDAARDAARQLATVEVDSPNGRFATDSALLNAIATTGRADARLTATIDALRKTMPPAAAPAVDAKRLERLRAAETPDALRAGGEVAGVPMSQDPRMETFAKKLAKVLRWIWKKIEQFYDWVMSWWPQGRVRKISNSFGGTPWLVAAVVILIVAVLAILALEIARRSRRRVAVEVAESDPIASRRDEDPLSRGANEWERYAAQLAAAGRIREAIRAWYHAVLVTLYGAGILHFRKGRTNWEYVSALAPDITWRGEFVQLTRRFEQEWYGHDASGDEALEDCSGRARRILEVVRHSRGVAA
jgi:hypothetical protein